MARPNIKSLDFDRVLAKYWKLQAKTRKTEKLKEGELNLRVILHRKLNKESTRAYRVTRVSASVPHSSRNSAAKAVKVKVF